MPVHIQETNNTGRGSILESTLQMSNNSITGVDSMEFNTAHTPNGEPIGSAYWNADEDTLDVRVNSNVTLQVGQEVLFSGKNQTGSTINNGDFVMFAGTLGNSGIFLIQKGIADGSLPSGYTMGLATEDILNGGDGKITWFGKVRGIDTTGTPYGEVWNDGDILYATTTAGALTNVKPTSGQVIEVAAVIHASNKGTLFVRPTWYDKDNDVLTKTTDYTIDGKETDGELVLFVDASSNDVDITLPSPSVLGNRFININRVDDSLNDVTIIGTVNGIVNPQIQYQNTSIRIVSNSTIYRIV